LVNTVFTYVVYLEILSPEGQASGHLPGQYIYP